MAKTPSLWSLSKPAFTPDFAKSRGSDSLFLTSGPGSQSSTSKAAILLCLKTKQADIAGSEFPPTNAAAGVQTSTITVAVLKIPRPEEVKLRDADLEITAARGGGPGGQRRNKVDTAVQVRHLPTGMLIRCETERSQFQNRELALNVLRSKLHAAGQEQHHLSINTMPETANRGPA